MKIYRYVFSGVRIFTPFVLPTIAPDDGAPFYADLVVHTAPVSLPPVTAVSVGLGMWVGEGVVWYVIPRLGRFCLDRTGLRIDLDPDASPLLLEQILCGHVLVSALHLAAILPLHASCVAHAGGAVAFAGLRGTGKSTLAAALVGRGWSTLADDLVAVCTEPGGRAVAWPGPPRRRLTPESLQALGFASDGGIDAPFGHKRLVVPPKLDWQSVPVPLVAVVELTIGEGGAVRLGAAAAAAVLYEHTFRRRLLAPLGLKNENAMQCASVAGRLPVFRLPRSDGLGRLDVLTEKVVSLLAKL